EILDQPAPPHRIEFECVDQRDEKRDVASADFDVGEPQRGGRLQRQRQHFGIGSGAILPPERFDAGLQELARASAAIAKHRAEIAEPGGLAGPAGGQIIPRDRNGEVGAKTKFLPAGIGGEIEALPDVFTGKVEKRLGRLQDRRLGPHVTGLRERQEQGVRPGGGPGRTWGGGQAHLRSPMISGNRFQRLEVAAPLAWPGRGFDRERPSGLMSTKRGSDPPAGPPEATNGGHRRSSRPVRSGSAPAPPPPRYRRAAPSGQAKPAAP